MNEEVTISLIKKPQKHLRFYGESSKYRRLSVMIVSTSQFCKLLTKALLEKNKTCFSNDFHIEVCESVEQALQSSERDIHTDFLAIVLDTRNRQCIDTVEMNMSLVDPLFTCGRVCIVNGTCSMRRPCDLGVPLSNIHLVAGKYSSILLNGDVLDNRKCLHLAEKILTLAANTCGYETSFPYISELP